MDIFMSDSDYRCAWFCPITDLNTANDTPGYNINKRAALEEAVNLPCFCLRPINTLHNIH